jgi:hypothetical protein
MLVLVLVLSLLGFAAPAAAHAGDTTVEHRVTGAPAIGLIGDSTLAGVRWYDTFGPLQRYSYVFDAESCRRTVETSCWSREGYRPDTALQTLERLEGRWGQVLVAMLGYNDSPTDFRWAVGAMTDEARRQGLGHVVWLTLRVSDVGYEEPLHRANATTYRAANTALLDLAASSGGFLQVADWATHSEGRPEWFESDGAHLTREGAEALAAFVADEVETVLGGGTVTPEKPPWYPLGQGERGAEVVAVQEALASAGFELDGGADGVFGEATAEAVERVQRDRRLVPTGVVDRATAESLGLRPPRAAAEAVTPTTVAAPRALAATPPVAAVPPPERDLSWLPIAAIPGLALAIGGLLWPGRSRRHPAR